MNPLLTDTAERATRYVEGIASRKVLPSLDAIARLDGLGGPLPENSCDTATLIALLDDLGSPATVATTGGRYFGFVIGGTLPAVMNAANEIAVAAFLARELRFPQIWETVGQVMDRHQSVAHPDLDAILAADKWAREEARRLIGK